MVIFPDSRWVFKDHRRSWIGIRGPTVAGIVDHVVQLSDKIADKLDTAQIDGTSAGRNDSAVDVARR